MSIEIVDVSISPSAPLRGGNIDLPRAGSRVSGATMVLEGWALGKLAAGRSVEAVHGVVVLSQAPLALCRTDVVAAFPSAPGVESCGFRLHVELPPVEAADVIVRVVMPDRSTVLLGTVHTRRSSDAPAASPAALQFGDLRRTVPISRDFGFDRGQPIDRYYIDQFLACRKDDIRGRVLEVGDDSYTRAFGGDRVRTRDVLHISEANPYATIVADLSRADHIPSNLFDCIILTQTLHLIYDVKAALQTLLRILKPGGVLLATFPGISQIARDEWGDSWYWSFTVLSAKRMFAVVFGERLEIQQWGNVLTATSFLQGIAAEELRPDELLADDPLYPVLLGARAQKQPAATEVTRGPSTVMPRIGILVYHRVADLDVDPWALAVTPGHFTEQLETLRDEGYHPLRLQDLVHHHAGDLPDRSVILTADDGYADNLEEMLPSLERHQVPATIFIATGLLGAAREFWWDDLERLILGSIGLPSLLCLTIAGTRYQWKTGGGVPPCPDRWRAWEDPPGPRFLLFRSLWELLHPLPQSERNAVLADLRMQAGADCADATARPSHRLLDVPGLASLASSPFIEIGAHTVTHPSLGSISQHAQRVEIRDGKSRLEALIQRPVISFAFPFGKDGDFNETTIELLRECGTACACTTRPTLVPRQPDLFRLPRIHVPDLNGAAFRCLLDRIFAGRT